MSTTIANLYHCPDKRVPAGAVYVGRKGRGESGYFGNPFDLETYGRLALPLFESYFHKRLEIDPGFAKNVSALKDQVLVCFCRPAGGFRGVLRCHAQIIAAHLDGCRPEEIP